MINLVIFDVAPINFVVPILLFVLLPVAAVICIIIAIVIIRKRNKKKNKALTCGEPQENKEAKQPKKGK
ncbi:MAG: hypothetical protein WCS90_04335 [Bacilli bacterium]